MIRARRVVFATGYETPEFLGFPGRSLCKLKSTYALASEPVGDVGGWHDRCLIWETARPYFYARTAPGGVVMVGGEDEPFVAAGPRDQLIPDKARALAGKFRALFPGTPITPACAWAGTFAETKDGLPYIGSVPQFPKGHFALGYGGNGITFSLIAAEIIRDLVLGRRNDDARLFRFGR
jgi:glycine/D-amino acid oxidase-like deaminating enzyme